MKFLLDTHSFLWFVTDDPLLSERARGLIAEQMPVTTADPAFDLYPVCRCW